LPFLAEYRSPVAAYYPPNKSISLCNAVEYQRKSGAAPARNKKISRRNGSSLATGFIYSNMTHPLDEWNALMFVELIYDKRNVAGLPGAREMILQELEKRVQRVFPDVEVRVKPMERNAIDTDLSKNDKATVARIVEEMFDEAEMWLVAE